MNDDLHVPTALPPGKRAPDTKGIEGWVDAEYGMVTLQKKKSLTPPGNRTNIPRSSRP